MSEANKDLLEKYRKEVALRRKYHEQLVELKGGLTKHFTNVTILFPPHCDYSLAFSNDQVISVCCAV